MDLYNSDRNILFFLIVRTNKSDIEAQDRCHYIRQTKPVMVYGMVAANTMDHKIIERQLQPAEDGYTQRFIFSMQFTTCPGALH